MRGYAFMKEKTYSLESIIQELRDQHGIETKILNTIVMEILGGMGVSTTSLKSDKGRYKFSQLGHDFWIDALTNYTEPPYCHIRERDYGKIDPQFIKKFLSMVAESMKNVQKSPDEIYTVLMEIDATVGYNQKICEELYSKEVQKFLRAYLAAMDSRHYLLLTDKICIHQYILNTVVKNHLNAILEEAMNIMEYFDNDRLSEAHMAANNMDAPLANAIIMSDEIADQKRPEELK